MIEQYTHPPGILVSEHYNQPFGYSCYRPGGTKDWLIMYTLSGRGLINNGLELLECRKDMITIVPPGTLHDYYTANDSVWEKLWAHFYPRPTWLDWIPTGNTGSSVIHIHVGNLAVQTLIYSAFLRLISYNLDSFMHQREELAMNALEEIILLVRSQTEVQKQLDPRVKDVLVVLSQQYAEDHQVEVLAKMVCLSPSRLSHLFKEEVGDSIIETLTKYRLKQAEKLLAFTTLPVTDIAIQVGFNSPDYFTRQFTTYYGMNPTQYRKRNREQRQPEPTSELRPPNKRRIIREF